MNTSNKTNNSDSTQIARRKMNEYLEVASKTNDESTRRKAMRNAKRWAKKCGESIGNKARQTRQLIKAFIELTPAGRAALYASIMSLSLAQNGKPNEARQWWQVVAFIVPDVAQKFASHLA